MSKRKKCPTGKARYHDAEDAKRAMRVVKANVHTGNLRDTGKQPQRSYHCARCGGWHLTSQDLRS